jgi:hypothetical protein
MVVITPTIGVEHACLRDKRSILLKCRRRRFTWSENRFPVVAGGWYAGKIVCSSTTEGGGMTWYLSASLEQDLVSIKMHIDIKQNTTIIIKWRIHSLVSLHL